MPIESVCTGCGRTLRVADEHAGAQAQCPICSTVYRVPMPDPQVATQSATHLATQLAASPAIAPASETPSAPVAETTLYFAKIPSGAEFGPAPASILAHWASEGRLNASCYVRPQQSTFWVPYNEWLQSHAQRTTGSVFSGPSPNAFGTIPSTSAQTVVYPKSGRGTLVLVLGIASWFLCLSWVGTIPVAIFAIYLGRTDLKSIARGEMSPKERTMTLIGMWLAAIALALNLILLFLVIASMVFGI